LDDGTPVVQRRIDQGAAGVKGFVPIVTNNRITIPVTAGQKVTTKIFDINGRKIGPTFSKTVQSSGNFSYAPLAGNTSGSAAKVYLVNVKVGEHEATVKMMNVGTGYSGETFSKASSLRGVQGSAVAKIAAAIDTVRIGKNGYFPVYKVITSYTDDLGEVTLKKMNVETIVDSIVNSMTNDQKAGQLTQVNFGNYLTNDSYVRDNLVGSAMCGGGDGPSDGQSINSWAEWMKKFTDATSNKGFPLFIGHDNVHGLDKTIDGTILPHNCGLGCSFDPQLIELAWRMAAVEMAGIGQNWVLAPCAAVPRDDRWGRLYEGFGEEPNNTAQMVKAAVLGLQGSDLSSPRAIAACMKHFIDGSAENGKNGTDAQTTGANEGLTKDQIYQIHTKPYAEAFKVGAASVMISYCKWFDTPMHQSSEIMTDFLRTKLKFTGWANGDWQAHENDGGTVASSVNNGLDVCMPGHENDKLLRILTDYKAYINNGTNPTRINDALKNLMRQKVLKFYSNGFRNNDPDPAAKGVIGKEDHHKIARVVARKSMVLLQNKNSALPLAKGAKVAVLGKPLRHEGLMCGGWTYVWQGNPEQDVNGCTSIFEGLQSQNDNAANVSYSETNADIANNADVVFVGYGEEYYAEADFPDLDPSATTPFDGQDNITYDQKALVNSVIAKGKKTVLVVVSGRPIDISEFKDKVDAIIIAWWPGSEGGNALADLAYGTYDFTAKLAYTWPASLAQEPINYGFPGTGTDNYKGKVPLFPYDFGLNLKGEELPKGLYNKVSIDAL
jgi:beta-glucosidase